MSLPQLLSSSNFTTSLKQRECCSIEKATPGPYWAEMMEGFPNGRVWLLCPPFVSAGLIFFHRMENCTVIKTKFPLLGHRPHYEPLDSLCSLLGIPPWYHFRRDPFERGSKQAGGMNQRTTRKQLLGGSYLVCFCFQLLGVVTNRKLNIFAEPAENHCANTPQGVYVNVKGMFYMGSALPPAFTHLICDHYHQCSLLWKHPLWFSIQYWVEFIQMYMYASINVCTAFNIRKNPIL